MAAAVPKTMAGIVISAGKMMKTVTVRMTRQHWNRRIKKYFAIPYKLLINDPTNAVREGDVIQFTPEPHSKRVRNTVSRIIAPFGTPLEDRPSLLTEAERSSIFEEKKAGKEERRAQRRAVGKQPLSGQKRRVPNVGDEDPETTIVDDGRVVLEGGKHKFGKINREARWNKKRAMEQFKKAQENERELAEVKRTPMEDIAEEDLRQKEELR